MRNGLKRVCIIAKEAFYHKNTVFFLFLMCLGILSLLVSVLLPEHSLLARLFDHLGAALIVVGGFGVFERSNAEDHLGKSIIRIFGITELTWKAGITGVQMIPSHLPFDPRFIETSQSLSLVFNDGAKWISNHFANLEKRFSLDGHLTELFVVDPHSPLVSYLAQKVGDSDDVVRDKILKSERELKAHFQNSPHCGTLKIYYLPRLPAYTAYLSENKAIITLYTTSSNRRQVPEFTAIKGDRAESLYEFIHSDVKELRHTAKIAFNSDDHQSEGPSRTS